MTGPSKTTNQPHEPSNQRRLCLSRPWRLYSLISASSIMHFALPPRPSVHPPPYARSSRSSIASLRQKPFQVTAIVAFAFFIFYLFLSLVVSGDGEEPIPAGAPKVVIVTVFDEASMGKEYISKIKQNREDYAGRHGMNALLRLPTISPCLFLYCLRICNHFLGRRWLFLFYFLHPQKVIHSPIRSSETGLIWLQTNSSNSRLHQLLHQHNLLSPIPRFLPFILGCRSSSPPRYDTPSAYAMDILSISSCPHYESLVEPPRSYPLSKQTVILKA